MKFMRLFSLLFLACSMALAPHTIACAPASPPLGDGCSDFLATLHIKPPHVQFVKCELNTSRQGKPLVASYRVAGVHAAAAEAHLVRVAHMPRLKKSCCQWDGPAGQFTGKDGKSYSASMVSPETSVKYRKQWRHIASFEIVVETLTEPI